MCVYIYIYIYIYPPPVPIHSKIDYIEVGKICISASVKKVSLPSPPYLVTTCNLHVVMDLKNLARYDQLLLFVRLYTDLNLTTGMKYHAHFCKFRFLDVTTKGVNVLSREYFCVSCGSHINSECISEDH